VRRKLSALLVAALMLAASVVTAPTVSAAEIGTISLWEHHNQVGWLETGSFQGGCANGRQYVGWVSSSNHIQRVSSLRINAGGLSNNLCNALYLRSASWDHPYWGTCVDVTRNQINFGQGYNDNVDAWVLRHSDGCPNFYLR